ncbi:MAG: LD-carboxypeptidase [Candidatus Omnitrophica bacterium]|nr:LD-carboxypeptidase [Candidatus Omnitrophota bacterium]
MIKPDRLKSDDTIGIIAPASSFDIDNFKTGVSVLKNCGYRVKYEPAIFNPCWSKPGHNRQRAAQINRMFADQKVKAILCAKGGSGSTEILPYLDPDIIKNNPKIFVGYSDITILLLYLQKIARMVVFHGPVVSHEIYADMNPMTLDYFFRLISNQSKNFKLSYPKMLAIRSGMASGILVGGNLSLIVKSLGGPYDFNSTGKILFLEDVEENLRNIKKYLIILKMAKKFDKIKGVIFGKMVGCYKREKNFIKVVLDVFTDNHFPILFRFPSGHSEKRGEFRITLPLGVHATIDADQMFVNINEPVVK